MKKRSFCNQLKKLSEKKSKFDSSTHLSTVDVNVQEFETDESETDSFSISENESFIKIDNCVKEENIFYYKEIEELKNWIVKSKISHVHADELLQILRCRLLPELPKSTKTLLKDKVTYEAETNFQKSQIVIEDCTKENDLLNLGLSTSAGIHLIKEIEIPMLNASNDICSSDFEQAVLSSLNKLNDKVDNLNNEVDILNKKQKKTCDFLVSKTINLSEDSLDLNKKYGISLPCKDVISFIKFDEDLRNKHFFKYDVMHVLHTCTDKDYIIPRTIVKMLKKFLTKDVAVNCTASRPSRKDDKVVFSSTEMWKCMEGVIVTVRQDKSLETHNKDLISALSDVLSNAKKWSV